MNPETGKIERVWGKTADGLDVFERDGLSLRFAALTWQRESHFAFAIELEFQTNELGHRRPYLLLHFGHWLFQSGWLFGVRETRNGR